MAAGNPSDQSIYPPTELVLINLAVDNDFSANPLRAISIGTAGILKVDMPNATGKAIPANCLAVGIQHVGIFTKIYSTANGTTASELTGWR